MGTVPAPNTLPENAATINGVRSQALRCYGTQGLLFGLTPHAHQRGNEVEERLQRRNPPRARGTAARRIGISGCAPARSARHTGQRIRGTRHSSARYCSKRNGICHVLFFRRVAPVRKQIYAPYKHWTLMPTNIAISRFPKASLIPHTSFFLWENGIPHPSLIQQGHYNPLPKQGIPPLNTRKPFPAVLISIGFVTDRILSYEPFHLSDSSNRRTQDWWGRVQRRGRPRWRRYEPENVCSRGRRQWVPVESGASSSAL